MRFDFTVIGRLVVHAAWSFYTAPKKNPMTYIIRIGHRVQHLILAQNESIAKSFDHIGDHSVRLDVIVAVGKIDEQLQFRQRIEPQVQIGGLKIFPDRWRHFPRMHMIVTVTGLMYMHSLIHAMTEIHADHVLIIIRIDSEIAVAHFTSCGRVG